MTTFLGEDAPVREPTIADICEGREYDGWPLVLMSLDNLLKHGKEGGIVNYYWPHEVKSVTTKRVTFVKAGQPIMDGDTELEAPGSPLMMDAGTARAFTLVWNAINEKNQGKVREYLNSRGLTCWMFDALIWPNVRYRGSA